MITSSAGFYCVYFTINISSGLLYMLAYQSSVVISLGSGMRASMCSWTTMMAMWAAAKGQLSGGLSECRALVLTLFFCCCCYRKVPGFLSAWWSQEAGTGPWWSEDVQLGSASSLPLPHVPARHGQDQSWPAPAPLQLWVLLSTPQLQYVLYIVLWNFEQNLYFFMLKYHLKTPCQNSNSQILIS